MKCRNCKCNGFLTDDDGKQFSWCHRYGDNLDIDEERYCSDYTPATNADRIRAMMDEELAKMINGFESFALDCGGAWPTENWLDWLKKEATNDQNNS